MPFSLTADETIPFTIDVSSIVDREGNPAQIQGSPTWASSDVTVLTIDLAPDGLSATGVSHRAGTVSVLVEADADLGDGVKTISGSDTGTVSAGQASAIVINAGTPQPKA